MPTSSGLDHPIDLVTGVHCTKIEQLNGRTGIREFGGIIWGWCKLL